MATPFKALPAHTKPTFNANIDDILSKLLASYGIPRKLLGCQSGNRATVSASAEVFKAAIERKS